MAKTATDKNTSQKFISENNDSKENVSHNPLGKLFVINETPPIEIGKKIYIEFNVHKKKSVKRLVAFLDSGADLSIIQESYLKRMFNSKELKDLDYKEQNFDLTSFSNDAISLIYSVELSMSLSITGTIFRFTFYVIKDIPGAPPLLLGADFMKRTLLSVSFTGEVKKPTPEVRTLKPRHTNIITYYYSERELYTCTAKVNLQPNESNTVKFVLNPASPCIPTDNILITGADESANIYVVPSKTPLKFDDIKRTYVAYALVQNVSPYKNSTTIQCTYEILNNTSRILPITRSNYNKISAYPLLSDVHNFKFSSTPYNIHVKDNIFSDKNPCSLVPPSLYKVSIDPYVKTESDIKPDELKKFYDKKHTAFGEPDFIDDAEFDPEIAEPKGHYVVNDFQKRPEDIVDLSKFDDIQRPYIEDIFLKKYPKILAKGALDSGNLSKTLGCYKLRLKENQILPKHKKVFFMNAVDSQHMKDILSFMIKNDIIQKAPISGDDGDLHGSPAYLIPKSSGSPNSSGRLIIDYRFLNSMLQCEPSILPSIDLTLHGLRSAAIYSITDLASAYYSFKLTKDSRWLTTFSTPHGLFQFKTMPMGISVACQSFQHVAYKMLHEKVVLDDKGKPIFDAENVVRMEPDPIEGCQNFFDDIIIYTKAYDTYELTIKKHYEKVALVMSRLAFHDARISFEKSNFGRFKVAYLGWLVSNGFIMANPKRLLKIKNAEFPKSIKQLRGFIGLINSLRLCLNFQHLEDIKHLTPLTSAKTPYQPTEFHERIFDKLKAKLLEKPIFSQMIEPSAKKVLFTDASPLDTSQWSCVLAQIIEHPTKDKYIPAYLTLDDPCHRIIFDNHLVYQPIPILRTEAETKEFHSSLQKTVAPLHLYLDEPYLGHDENVLYDSFFISIQAIMAAYRCKILDISEMRAAMVKQINKSVIRLKICDFIFNNDKHKTKEYINSLKNDGYLDSNFYCIEAFSYTIHRPVIVLSSLKENKNKPILTFNGNIVKPPFVVGAYKCNDKIIYLPYFVNRQNCYDLSQLKNQFQIIAYHCRALPQSTRGKAILDHELYAILNSVESMKKYTGGCELTLLTDSKPLYYLFHKDIHRSNVRLYRWSLKLRCENPNLKIEYIPSAQNLADFLSKRYNLLPGDMPRFSSKKITVTDLEKFLPPNKVFTINEWAQWVQENPGHIKELQENTSVNMINASLSTTTKNIDKYLKPFSVLEERMSHENIVMKQKIELSNIYESCLTSKNFTYSSNNETFKLLNNLVFQITKDGPKIVLPKSMIGLFLAYYHLITGHGGKKKLILALENYTFQHKTDLIEKFVSRCYPCQLNNKSTRKELVGIYPIQSYPFETIFMDLAENLGKSGQYEHLLIVTCPLSDMTLIFPLKSKTAEQISHILLYSILQYFHIKNIVSDNAPCFTEKKFISLLTILGINKVVTSALSPASKGQIEIKVKTVKTTLKKLLTTQDSYNYEGLPFLTSKLLNTSKSNKTGYTPLEFLFGNNSQHSTDPFTNEPILPKLHPLVQGNKEKLHEQQVSLHKMINETRQSLKELRTKQTEKVNKTRVHKTFNIGDVVFVLDRSYTVGSTKPLRSTYSKSPYVVLQTYPVTTLVQRISDKYTQIYSNNDIKKYNSLDTTFMDLPTEVLNVIKNNGSNLDKLQTHIIQMYDPYDIPDGQNLQSEENSTLNDKYYPPNDGNESNKDTDIHNINDTNKNNTSINNKLEKHSIPINNNIEFPENSLENENKLTEKSVNTTDIVQNSQTSNSPQTKHNAHDAQQSKVEHGGTSLTGGVEQLSPANTGLDHSSEDSSDSEDEHGLTPMQLRSGKKVRFK